MKPSTPLPSFDERRVEGLVERLIARTLELLPEAREGTVMSARAAPPYRRLDCDGRALCYVRLRPSRGGARIDLAGLWIPPQSLAASSTRTCSAVATFWLFRAEDEAKVAESLRATVEHTRAHHARLLRRGAPRALGSTRPAS